MLGAHVEEVLLEGGRAAGVRLRGRDGGDGAVVRASKAVVSNASLWDTQRLLPAGAVTPAMRRDAEVRCAPMDCLQEDQCEALPAEVRCGRTG
jgi:choline dehydrogenase-like flavoprotein